MRFNREKEFLHCLPLMAVQEKEKKIRMNPKSLCLDMIFSLSPDWVDLKGLLQNDKHEGNEGKTCKGLIL